MNRHEKTGLKLFVVGVILMSIAAFLITNGVLSSSGITLLAGMAFGFMIVGALFIAGGNLKP